MRHLFGALGGQKLAKSPGPVEWFVVYPRNLEGQMTPFIVQMRHVGREMGFDLPHPKK